jgi:hypothetical protein
MSRNVEKTSMPRPQFRATGLTIHTFASAWRAGKARFPTPRWNQRSNCRHAALAPRASLLNGRASVGGMKAYSRPAMRARSAAAAPMNALAPEALDAAAPRSAYSASKVRRSPSLVVSSFDLGKWFSSCPIGSGPRCAPRRATLAVARGALLRPNVTSCSSARRRRRSARARSGAQSSRRVGFHTSAAFATSRRVSA